jgi:hypothetical protein
MSNERQTDVDNDISSDVDNDANSDVIKPLITPASDVVAHDAIDVLLRQLITRC